MNYYNEFDPVAAEWLRWLISEGHLPNGWVDERSIVDVEPSDLEGFAQCHFFAGIGGWSLAARIAGWPEDRPLWTGSCPCQPFSVAGKGKGVDDVRHLWPDFFRLIRACRPPVVMGEQVAGAAGYGWFDGVAADLAGEGYACRAVDVPACAVDAPHIRSRLWWIAVGDAASERRGEGRAEPEFRGGRSAIAGADASSDLADTYGERCAETFGEPRDCAASDRQGAADSHQRFYVADGLYLADAMHEGLEGRRPECDAGQVGQVADASNGGTFWSGAGWITCHDGKARRAEPGIPLLAHGIPGRVAAWRGFGNAINPQTGAEIISAFLDTENI